MLQKVNDKLKHYVIEETTRAMTECGEYLNGRDGALIGYAVVNKANKIVEYTTMILPTAIFQADYMDKALESILTEEVDEDITQLPMEDVVPPLSH